MTETSGHKCFLSWFHWLKTSPHYENVTHLQDSSTSVKVAFSPCLAGQCNSMIFIGDQMTIITEGKFKIAIIFLILKLSYLVCIFYG